MGAFLSFFMNLKLVNRPKITRGGNYMLDVKFVRDNYEEVKAKLAKRGEDISEFDQFLPLDQKRRELIAKTEVLKAERNEVSQKISRPIDLSDFE